MAAVATSTRASKRARTHTEQSPAERRTSYSQNMIKDMVTKMKNVKSPQNLQTASPVEQQMANPWENNYDIAKMGEPTATPSSFLPDTSLYGFPQPQPGPHQQDGFLMPDFLKTGLTPRSGLTPRTGLTPFGFNGKDAGAFDSEMWDYFSLDDTHSGQIVAPHDLASTNTSTLNTQQAPIDPNVKIPKKRGRKRKQLDEKTQVEERKKFLERNRVAANRCRERKKTYVSNLETRQKDVLAKNQYLRVEVEALREEIAILKQLVHADCACSESTLEQNLRRKLGDSGQPHDDVETVVDKFKSMRASGDTSGTAMDALMQEMEAATPNSYTDESSVHDDIFSVIGEEDENGRTSADSSPVENEEVEKNRYPDL